MQFGYATYCIADTLSVNDLPKWRCLLRFKFRLDLSVCTRSLTAAK